MKNITITLALVAATLAAPVLSFAQSSDPITRAEVRADLIQVEKAGYTPSGDQIDYPANVQAAEARIAAQNGQQPAKQVSSGMQKTLGSRFHSLTHMKTSGSTCVGPVSFCNTYFGG
jgi:hypothetical protein